MSQSGTFINNSGSGGYVQTLNGATPLAGNINLTSTGGTIIITPGAHTVNLEAVTSGVLQVIAGNSISITGTASQPVVNVSGTANHSLLIGNSSNSINNLGLATNGQLPIGSTGASPVLATLTAGNGISIINAAGSITIASTSEGETWSVITASQTAAIGHGYFCNKAGTLALTLPAASAVGDTVEVANINTTTGTQIAQAAGQQIFIGNTSTTLGATGTLTSTALGDTLRLVCRVANTTYQCVSMIGNWTVV